MGVVALIPARSQSKRIPNKNIYPLAGRPLMAYSIAAARDSKVFDAVIVSTESEKYADLARTYGAEVIIRPPEYATDISPDYEWIKYTLSLLSSRGRRYEHFSILRPTSPFRTAETIQRAWRVYSESICSSLRAVELCGQHPYKMWKLEGEYIKPLIDSGLHSVPYQMLPKVYVQNASLEISQCANVLKYRTISGNAVVPFFTEGFEGWDINQPYDLRYAEWLIETGQAVLPRIN